MLQISKFILSDLIRNKVLVTYLLFLSLIGWGIFSVESQPEKAHLILLQVTLVVVPIFSMVFCGIYLYNSREFILLLLSQPVHRKVILSSLYLGMTSSNVVYYLIGIGIPLFFYYPTLSSFTLIASGIMLTVVFSSIAIFLSVFLQDKTKGLGVMIMTWAFFAFIFDGLLLFFMYQFADYPIEGLVMISTLLNPVDTARITVIMQTEASALMGLSGAIFHKVFGSSLGVILTMTDLIIWCIIPYLFARYKFVKKDF